MGVYGSRRKLPRTAEEENRKHQHVADTFKLNQLGPIPSLVVTYGRTRVALENATEAE